jgi:hypothetical protein
VPGGKHARANVGVPSVPHVASLEKSRQPEVLQMPISELQYGGGTNSVVRGP